MNGLKCPCFKKFLNKKLKEGAACRPLSGSQDLATLAAQGHGGQDLA